MIELLSIGNNSYLMWWLYLFCFSKFVTVGRNFDALDASYQWKGKFLCFGESDM